MKSWQLAVVGVACLVLSGCRADPNIVLLERELRLQEDEIYSLREVVEDYQAALRSRREGAALPGRPRTFVPGSGGVPGVPRVEGIPSVEGENGTRPEGAEYGDPGTEAPRFRSGDPSQLPPRERPPDDSSEDKPVEGPGQIELPVPAPSDDNGAAEAKVRPAGGTGPILPADSSQVAQLGLNRLLTGGYDADGRPGDDGIVVGLQLRDARGRRVEAPADVSVMLLDPALVGEAARVARWDFTAAEMGAGFQRTGPGRAIQLEMVWPDDPPVHSQLYLFVRYTTSDGRRMQAEGPIQIALPAETSRRWVPAKPPAPDLEARLSADVGGSGQAEPRQGGVTPAVHMATSQSTSPVAGPAEPKIEPPVWSPHRR